MKERIISVKSCIACGKDHKQVQVVEDKFVCYDSMKIVTVKEK